MKSLNCLSDSMSGRNGQSQNLSATDHRASSREDGGAGHVGRLTRLPTASRSVLPSFPFLPLRVLLPRLLPRLPRRVLLPRLLPRLPHGVQLPRLLPRQWLGPRRRVRTRAVRDWRMRGDARPALCNLRRHLPRPARESLQRSLHRRDLPASHATGVT